MASLFVLGNHLIDSEEYKEKMLTGQIDQLLTAAEENKSLRVGFRDMSIASEDLKEVEFKPIGIGKPLSVEIMTVYTGDFISNKFLSAKKRDLLCVSGVKSAQTFEATARAINMLEAGAKENSYLEFAALKAGTPFVFYTKAVDSDSLLITIELDSNSFNDGIFNAIADLIGKAAGLPIFMPAASYLLAGSQVLKIGAEGANNLFESSPFINETIPLRFATAGLPTNIARRVLLCRQEDKAELQQYRIESIDDGGAYKVRLIKDGKPYQGKAPYLIINIDGAEKPWLNTFTPTLATTAILKKFYGGTSKVDDAAGMLLQAMTLYNDFSYRTKADRMEQELERLKENPDSDEYKSAKALYEAYLKNIQNDLLKKT
jgi:hypothetical protein